MAGIDYAIVQELAILSEKSGGWNKELNLVSWNNREAKLDIREWDPAHEKMGKGITLTRSEARELYRALGEYLGEGSTTSHSGKTLSDDDLALFRD